MARKKYGDLQTGTSWSEFWSILIASVFVGFAISYNNWGFGADFIFSVGLINLFLATLICAFTLWFKTILQKHAGRSELLNVEFKYSWTNLFYVLILSIFTNGYFVFAATGRPKVKSVTHLRPGYLEPHAGPYQIGRTVAAGTVASIILIVLAKIWISLGGGLLATYLLRTNTWMLLVSLVPIPLEGLTLLYQKAPITKTFHSIYPGLAKAVYNFTPSFEGEQMFFGSRPLWFFLTVTSIFLVGLVRTTLSATDSLIWSIILGFVAVLLWFHAESKNFKLK